MFECSIILAVQDGAVKHFRSIRYRLRVDDVCIIQFNSIQFIMFYCDFSTGGIALRLSFPFF